MSKIVTQIRGCAGSQVLQNDSTACQWAVIFLFFSNDQRLVGKSAVHTTFLIATVQFLSGPLAAYGVNLIKKYDKLYQSKKTPKIS